MLIIVGFRGVSWRQKGSRKSRAWQVISAESILIRIRLGQVVYISQTKWTAQKKTAEFKMKDKCNENFKCRTLGTSVSVLSRFQNADFLLFNLKILFKLQVFQLRLDCSKIKTMVIDETLDQNGQHLSIYVHFFLTGSCHIENIA